MPVRPICLLSSSLLIGLMAFSGAHGGQDGNPAIGLTPAPSIETPVSPRPARPDGAVMVPERFLRAWDPVTIFFDRPQGPAEAGVVLDPENVSMTPEHPGMFQWLDSQTLQFRPVDPWPPLTRFTWTIDQQEHELVTLMAPAIDSHPADGADGLAPVDTVHLYFRDPVDPAALEDMLDLTVYPRPAVDGSPVRQLSREDFTLQPLERGGRGQPAGYRLRLTEPVGEGMEARLKLRLALEDDSHLSFQTIRFSTRRPFRPVSFGCVGEQRTVTREGTSYPADDALVCPTANRHLELQLTAEPGAIDPVLGRNLLRVEPRVDDLSYSQRGEAIRLSGDFRPDTLYRLRLEPAALQDVHGRTLALDGGSSLYFSFPAPADFLEINRGRGRVMMERHGPRMLPLRGRGDARVDVRIHAIDNDALNFWPYTDGPVSVADDARPPGPGEEPVPRTGLRMSAVALADRIRTLGTPSVSEIVHLPLAGEDRAARFGLDLAPYLERIHRGGRPGTYLVGLRRLEADDQRQWVRLQVTDLSLTVVEEEAGVRFFVTSLQTGQPVVGASVQIEALPARPGDDRLLVPRGQGRTDDQGAWLWQPRTGDRENRPERILVRHGADSMVIDATADAPPRFFDHHMGEAGGWLDWTGSRQAVTSRREPALWHCHLFTERPVYRPEEGVHIGGFVRRIHRGAMTIPDEAARLVITGPDGSEWRRDVDLDEGGGFHYLFDETTEATGDYRIQLTDTRSGRGRECAAVDVEKIAYRIPRFEVRLDGPARAGLDRPFQVELDAEYYAGGMVADRPVRWRVTQFPHHWVPAGREGFAFSSDARYGTVGEFESRPTLAREGTTSDRGIAVLEIDPAQEPTAQPRRYVFEATVTGDDDQTVTDTHQVLALPAFVLGLQAPRYLHQADQLDAAVIMVGPDDQLIAGQPLEIRLVRRRWAARLVSSDFSDGQPRYETEVIDETITEQVVTSADEAVDVRLPLDDTGVYLLELSARDSLGRSQTVMVDLFNDASARATWPQPPERTFQVSTEREEYAPGEQAHFILQSPVADATALAVVEQPDGSNDYHWLEVKGGRARFELPVEREHLPGVSVHFVLMRGRLPTAGNQGERRTDRNGLDPGKPVMMAATAGFAVSDRAHRIDVGLTHPPESRPGESVEIDIRLHDGNNRPLSGYVTLWLVDQAVLALGEEQRLDLLPDFLRSRPVRSAIRDTRNRPVGYLPFVTEPGGDTARERASADQILAGLTVRDRFETVPYYRHAIPVDETGQVRVRVDLPDDLTNFMLRAKAVAGPDRFGYQTSRLAVRQPVIVQPALPRFVRYGDTFTLSATSRVVDGDPGPGTAALALEGLEARHGTTRDFDWSDNGTARIDFDVQVPMPDQWSPDPDRVPSAAITLGVERLADGVGDAFAVQLPVHPDRPPVQRLGRFAIQPGEEIELEGPDEPVRAGSLKRSGLFSSRQEILLMAAGLNHLLQIPGGNSEQRISRARALLAARSLFVLLYPGHATDTIDRHVRGTLAYIDDAMTEDGSIGLWPGSSTGHVGVSAWALHLMVEAEAAGFPVDSARRQRLHDALQRGLRGGHDLYYSRYLERTLALTALAADGALDSGYAAELARRTQFLPTEASARVAQALAVESDPGQAMLDRLGERLWSDLVFQLRDGEPVYAGLKESGTQASPMIFPSETRTIAQVLQALQALAGEPHRQRQLVDVLVQLGGDNGWGNSNANAEAILALVGALQEPETEAAVRLLRVSDAEQDREVDLGGDTPLQRLDLAGDGPVRVRSDADLPVGLVHQMAFVPAAGGDQARAESRGFVVERRLVRVEGGQEQALDQPGEEIPMTVGEVIEDRLRLVSSEERFHVAVVLPLAAGMEPLDPRLRTAPPEARPSRPISHPPSHAVYRDHEVVFYYDSLPAGTHEFAFRSRAQVAGRFVQPAAFAELMYQPGVRGQSHGAAVVVTRP